MCLSVSFPKHTEIHSQGHVSTHQLCAHSHNTYLQQDSARYHLLQEPFLVALGSTNCPLLSPTSLVPCALLRKSIYSTDMVRCPTCPVTTGKPLEDRDPVSLSQHPSTRTIQNLCVDWAGLALSSPSKIFLLQWPHPAVPTTPIPSIRTNST